MTRFDPTGWMPARTPEEQNARKVSDMAGRIGDAERALLFAAFSVQSPWVEPTYLSPFQADAADPLRFYIDPVGRVYIEGSFVSTSTFAGNTPIFTLPEGYRPRRLYKFPIRWDTGSGTGSSATGLYIWPDGTVQYFTSAAGGSAPVTHTIGTEVQYRAVQPGEVVVTPVSED